MLILLQKVKFGKKIKGIVKPIYVLGYVMFILSCKTIPQPPISLLDDDLPGLQPKRFAPHKISLANEAEFGSVFNKKGDEFYYGVDLGNRSEIRYTKLVNGRWLAPTTIISDSVYGYNDPFLSPDEQRLYYISQQPRDQTDTIADHDIWYSTRMNNSWSAPINAGPAINTDRDEYYISFTTTGKMYFSSNKEAEEKRKHNFDIYSSRFVNSKFQEAEKLSAAINTRAYEADVFISPDESYIIYCSARRSGMGRGDLYISFKTATNTWTEAIGMGDQINTENHELCPFVTHDGKYFFYTSRQDIYWVSAEIIERLKVEVLGKE